MNLYSLRTQSQVTNAAVCVSYMVYFRTGSITKAGKSLCLIERDSSLTHPLTHTQTQSQATPNSLGPVLRHCQRWLMTDPNEETTDLRLIVNQ